MSHTCINTRNHSLRIFRPCLTRSRRDCCNSIFEKTPNQPCCAVCCGQPVTAWTSSHINVSAMAIISCQLTRQLHKQGGRGGCVCQLFSHKSSCSTSCILTLTSRGYFFHKTIKKRRLNRKTTDALAALDISGSTWAQWIWKKKLQQQYPFKNHACSSAHCDRECCFFVPPFFFVLAITLGVPSGIVSIKKNSTRLQKEGVRYMGEHLMELKWPPTSF